MKTAQQANQLNIHAHLNNIIHCFCRNKFVLVIHIHIYIYIILYYHAPNFIIQGLVQERSTLGGGKALVLVLLELNQFIMEEPVGVPVSFLVEEGEKSFVCPLILTTSTLSILIAPSIFLLYMVQNMTPSLAHSITQQITMLPVLSAWLPPELP